MKHWTGNGLVCEDCHDCGKEQTAPVLRWVTHFRRCDECWQAAIAENRLDASDGIIRGVLPQIDDR